MDLAFVACVTVVLAFLRDPLVAFVPDRDFALVDRSLLVFVAFVDFFAVDFFVDFFAVDFFAVDFFAVDFFADLPDDFAVVVRFVVDFFVDFFAVDFFAVDFFAVDFFAVDFFVDFFAVGFFFVAFAFFLVVFFFARFFAIVAPRSPANLAQAYFFRFVVPPLPSRASRSGTCRSG